MLRNGQTSFKNLALFTPQDVQSMFEHFSVFHMEGLHEGNMKSQCYMKSFMIQKMLLFFN